MPISIKPTSVSKKINIKKSFRFILFIALGFTFISIILTVFFTDLFLVKSMKISVNGQIENAISDSRAELEYLILNKNILFLNKKQIEKSFLDKYKNIQSINLSINLDRSVNARVQLYEVKYIGCVKEEGFLIPCMYGDVNGVFFKESDLNINSEKVNFDKEKKELLMKDALYYIEINKSTLSLIENNSEDRQVDSLAGARIYDDKSMNTLLRYIKWVESLGFIVADIDAGELKVVKIHTNKLDFIISLDKNMEGAKEDYETLNSQDFFKDLDRENLSQIDLSFKNKIFYKEKDAINLLENKASTTPIRLEPIATSTATSSR